MTADTRTVLPAVLQELTEDQAVLTLRFALHVLARDDLSQVDEMLRAVSTFDLSHLVHLACLLDDDSRADLVFRAEDLLRARRAGGGGDIAASP